MLQSFFPKAKLYQTSNSFQTLVFFLREKREVAQTHDISLLLFPAFCVGRVFITLREEKQALSGGFAAIKL